ncbi:MULTISPECIES: ATP-binding cassette domain-containing protein [Clostridium]|uniref:ATP-binding cassette domain-containing protein n=1 Tax=Clostridium TaxID=1485 RepID=UPI0003F7DDE8|nr:ATP-binding cassette domain-containing protein [Clostridium cadaveris]MDU4953403.1 ATP-binding cassette domain-containing protein [Clostridium sp.]
MIENILATRNISKKYGNKLAVTDVSMTVKKGDIYGLVGKNGAGKTTLIRMALSLTSPTSGDFELFDANNEPDRIRMHTRVGCIVETPAFYPYLTAKENLEYYRIQRGIVDKNCVDEALKLVGLIDTGKKKFKGFSLGMKQRLGLALAIMGSPDFLILDEPINGLDPMGIKEIRDLLLMLNRIRNTTILISSHILGELSQLATCYGFINNGKLVQEISAQELDERCKHCVSIKVDDAESAAAILEEKLKCKDYEVLNNNLIKVYAYLDEPHVVNKALLNAGVMVSSLERVGSSLEEYFLELVGGEKND